MIPFLNGLYFFIKSLPQILEALQELKKLFDAYLTHEQKKEAMQLLGDAFNVARNQHDTTKLTELVNNIIARKPLR